MSVKFFVRSFVSFFLIVSITLMNVSIALAEGPTPPVATEEPTQDPAVTPSQPEPVATEMPAEETSSTGDPAPAEEEASAAGPFALLPVDTEVVVLDESGNVIPLVTQDALNAILEDDPMWCPGNTAPGGPGCINFAGATGITALLADMRNNTGIYDVASATIYFTANPGNGAFALTDATLFTPGDYDALKDTNLVLQGGWNGNTNNPQYNTQTNFGVDYFNIGTSGNPWLGNITINNITVDGATSSTNPSVGVYTTSGSVTMSDVIVKNAANQDGIVVNTTSGDVNLTNIDVNDGKGGNGVVVTTNSGDITLSNVDVSNQADGNTANLVSTSGDITVQTRSSFVGNNNNNNTNQGFNASTTTGAITITGDSSTPISFKYASGSGTGTNYNGATLSAPTVSLSYVTAAGNDLNGIYITNASTVILDNVVGGNNSNGGNGTVLGGANNLGSGVYILGTGNTNVSITGGAFYRNARYGIELVNGTITVVSAPTFGSFGNRNLLGNSLTPPTLILPANITREATGSTGAAVTYTVSATDWEDNPDPTPSCSPVSGSTFGITTTTVNCTVTDANGASKSSQFTVTVRDTTPPTIAAHGPVTAEATSASGAVVTYSNPSTTDLVDGIGAATCAPASGSTFPVGNTTITCNATDAHNNPATPTTFTVSVVDTTAPMIAAHGPVTAEATSASGAVVTYTNPATSDLVDGVGMATCVPASGSTFALGNNTVTCNAMDAHNNSAVPTTFTISVVDTTGPVLTLPSNMTVEATSASGATVTYAASALDAVDGTRPVSCLPTSPSAFAMGLTTVNCSSTDTHNNTSNGSFTVLVADTSAPVIAAHGSETAEATSPVGAVVTYTNPTTSDAKDGAGIATCAPASGSTFALGSTTVTCNATDTQGNAATPTNFTVSVIDTTAPVIAAHGPVTAEATSAAGTIVTYTSPATSDIVDGAGTATCLPASGTLFALGNTVVTCNITDTYANVATPTTFNVSVVDTTAPVIAAHSDVTVQATSASGAVVTYNNPTTSDAVDGAGIAICTPVSGSTYVVGNTTVTCTANDSHGNIAALVIFTVHVQGMSTTQVTSSSSSSSSSSLIPVTGGVIDLDCNTMVMINGIRVIFHNLCNQQAVLNGVDASHLPGKLPAGFTFVSGLDVSVIGQAVLPANTGIEMDFPASASGQFAVLFWDNGKWVEITQSLNESDLAKALSSDPSNELYKLLSAEKGMFKSLTTEKTGIFILVKK